MYDKLIAELRQHHCDAKEDDTQEFCEECAYDVIIADKSVPSGLASVCVCGLMNRAADAIEELSVVVRAQKDVLNQSPHWIPAEDCLPVNGEEIITLGPNGGMECGFFRGLCGTHKDKWEWKKHTVRTVKFWMPRKALPQPPKEE